MDIYLYDVAAENEVYSNPILLAKYNEFVNIAASYGIKIDCCLCSTLEKSETKQTTTSK